MALFTSDCLSYGKSHGHPREDIAAWIVGLGKVDAYDRWYEESEEFADVTNLAETAELSADLADELWDELLVAVSRFLRATSRPADRH